jgi:hypothetical protein
LLTLRALTFSLTLRALTFSLTLRALTFSPPLQALTFSPLLLNDPSLRARKNWRLRWACPGGAEDCSLDIPAFIWMASTGLCASGPRLRPDIVQKPSSRRGRPGGDGFSVDYSLVKTLALRWDKPSGGANFFSRSPACRQACQLSLTVAHVSSYPQLFWSW